MELGVRGNMEINTGTDLENDIKYIKSVLSRCTVACRNIDAAFSTSNKIFSHRINFIQNQFKGIFNQHFII